MRGASPAGIMVEVGGVKTRRVLTAEERRRAYAPLRGPGELDRPRCQKRQGDPPAYRQRRYARRQARVEVGASLLDRRSLRYGHHLRGTRRRSPERPPSGDRLSWQRANHHAPGLQRGRDVGDTPEAPLSRSTSRIATGVFAAYSALRIGRTFKSGHRLLDSSSVPRKVLKPCLLLPVVLCYLFEEGVVDLVAANFPQRLALGKDHTVVLAAGNAVIRVAGLSRTVDHAAHDGDGEVILEVLEPLLDLSRHPDHVESERACATRTRDDVGPTVPEVEGREYLIGHRYLLDGVLCERDADSVPDPVGQELP